MRHNRRNSSIRHNIRILPGQLGKKELLIGLGIFILALLVRLLYLYESSANPSFVCPTVDSNIYDSAARSLSAGDGMGDVFFRQPFFYPFFLTIVYLTSNSSIICAKVIQVLLGCVTCFLTYRLGRGAFGRGTGIIAGIITALYGPLIFFEAELLGSGWAALWSVVLLLLFLKSSSKKSIWLCFVLGICAALSIITRPTFVPFVAVTVVWLAIIFYRAGDRWRKIALRFGGILTGFLLIAVPIAAQNFRITGHFGILPSSGGINFYIGNNPNYAETLPARPGWDWEEITELPRRSGVVGDQWEQQKFFKQKVINYVFTEPFEFVKGLARKSIQFLNSREIPRNVDVYLFGKWSRLLSLLVWQVGGFGFPFGVLLPLALLGAVSYWRQVPVPLLLFVILYPLSIILVFVTARYRVPVIPAMSIMAAAGLLNLVGVVRELCWRRIVVLSVFGAGIVLLSSLPGPFPEEEANFEAELYYNVGTFKGKRGENREAFAHLSKAVELMPDHAKAHNNLGMTLLALNKLDEAISHYRQALQVKPDYARAHTNLAIALKSQGKLDEAVKHYRLALRGSLDYAKAHDNLAIALHSRGKFDEAISHFRQALRIKPGDAKVHNNLGVTLYSQSKLDEAVSHFRQALRIKPDYPEARNNLDIALKSQGRLDEVVSHLRQELRIKPNDAGAHYSLGLRLRTAGQLDESLEHFQEAVRLKPDYPAPLNRMAWILATHPNPEVRNASQAIELAERAAELTKYQNASVLDTLAAAYAAAGQFDRAATTAQTAIALASTAEDDELVNHIRKRLALYKQTRPYREPVRSQDAVRP